MQHIDTIAPRVYESSSPSEQLVEEGFEILGSGTGRIVATHDDLDGDFAIKFAAKSPADDPYADGRVQNHVERYIVTTGHPLAIYHLPLCASPNDSSNWLIYPRVSPESHDAHLFRVFDELEELGFTEQDLFAPDHWAYYKDQWRLIDCGYVHPDETELHLPDEAYPDWL